MNAQQDLQYADCHLINGEEQGDTGRSELIQGKFSPPSVKGKKLCRK